MDTLNDVLLDNIRNYDESHLPDYDEEYIDYLETLNGPHTFDDWCCLYSDDLWYLWCRIQEITNVYSKMPIMDTMTYPEFCSVCYEHSSKL